MGDLLTTGMLREGKEVVNGPGTFCLCLPDERRIEVEENPVSGKWRGVELMDMHLQTWPSNWLEIPSCVT